MLMAVGCAEALLGFDVEKPEGMMSCVVGIDWSMNEWLWLISSVVGIDWLIGKDSVESLIFHVSIDP